MHTIIAVDIGNTDTVVGLFRGEELSAQLRMRNTGARNVTIIWREVRTFLRRNRLSTIGITGVVISSVVPKATTVFASMSRKHLHVSPLIVSGTLDVGMRVRYDNPKSLGPDRLSNAVAASSKYGSPCIIVDLGTATTFDVVSKSGEFLGGAIAPGIATAAAELYRRTSLLPKVHLKFPRRAIGKNTMENLQSGILLGAIDALEGMVRRIKKVLGADAVVVATGGFAKLVARHSKVIDHVEPALVLEGARMIFEKVQESNRSRKKRM